MWRIGLNRGNPSSTRNYKNNKKIFGADREFNILTIALNLKIFLMTRRKLPQI